MALVRGHDFWEPSLAQRGEGQNEFRDEALAMAENRPLLERPLDTGAAAPLFSANKWALHSILKRNILLFS